MTGAGSTFDIPVDLLTTAALVSVRTGALIMSVPALGGETVPLRIRAALVAILTFVMMFTVKPAVAEVSFIPAAIGELLIGLTMGLVVRVCFGAAELAGELVGTQVGFNLETTFNPLSSAESGVYAQLFTCAVGLVFFACGGHLELVKALAASIIRVPPGASALAFVTYDVVVRAFGETMLRGLAIAAPLTIAVLAGQVVLGVVARVAPALNPWSFGFLVTSGVALLGASMAMPALVQQLQAAVHASFADLTVWLTGGLP